MKVIPSRVIQRGGIEKTTPIISSVFHNGMIPSISLLSTERTMTSGKKKIIKDSLSMVPGGKQINFLFTTDQESAG